MRERLIEGKGNFGSVEGDAPAAMRYTEARLTHLGAILMEDIDKDTVNFVPSYDEKNMEPVVLPAAFPNLLVNGGTGIAVGMATNLAPHNLAEVIDAICAQIDKPDITIAAADDEAHQGPRFPHRLHDHRHRGHQELFRDRPRQREGPRQAPHRDAEGRQGTDHRHGNPLQREPRRAGLAHRGAGQRRRRLTEITDVRDESDESTRVVIELKRDAISQGRHQQALQDDGDGNVLRRQPARHRRAAGRRRSISRS